MKTGNHHLWGFATLAVFIVVAPLLLGESYFFDTVNIIGIYSIAVIGLNLILGYTGLISLGHSAFFGLGAYLSAYIAKNTDIPVLLALLIACILVALFAFLVSFPLLRLSGYFLALGTLGVCVIVYTLINGSNAITGGPNGMTGIPALSAGGYEFDSETSYFYLIWITVFLVLLLCRNLVHSREGRILKAVHSDEEAASFFGAPIAVHKMKVFVAGCTLAGLAGGFYAHYMAFISPDIVNLPASINMIIMGFLGGFGSIFGPVLGAFVYQLIPEISSYFEKFEPLIKGVILLLVILFFQGGMNAGIVKVQKYMSRHFAANRIKDRRGENVRGDGA